MRNPKFAAKTGRGTEADVEGPWLSGSLISHSTLSVGKPRTRLRQGFGVAGMGKDMTEARSPQRKLMPDTAGSDTHKQTSLWGIAFKAQF